MKMRLLHGVFLSLTICVGVITPVMSQPTLNEPQFDRLVPGVSGPPDKSVQTGNNAPPSVEKLNKHQAKSNDPLAGAKRAGLMPLALQESRGEIDDKLDFLLATEKAEMVDLWEATLNSSPDIQMVVQRLQPTSNRAHASTILSRILSAAIVGATGAARVVAPSPGATALTQSGSSILSGLLNSQDRKRLNKMNINDEQMIMLYKIVRDTADKVVENYRTYKRTVANYQGASADLADYKGMAVQLGPNDPHQMEMEYIIRKQKRDIDDIRFRLRQYRQQIVDLAGAKATLHLDEQLDDEFKNQLALPTGATPWDNWNKDEQPGT